MHPVHSINFFLPMFFGFQMRSVFLLFSRRCSSNLEAPALFHARKGNAFKSSSPSGSALFDWPDYTYKATGQGPSRDLEVLKSEYENYSLGLEIIRLNNLLKQTKAQYAEKLAEQAKPRKHTLKPKSEFFDI